MKELATIPSPPVLRPGERPSREMCHPSDVLLCVFGRSSENLEIAAHWENFKAAGASWVTGVGTNNGRVKFPEGSAVANIGDEEDPLRRIMLTVDWCLNAMVWDGRFKAFNHFVIADPLVVFRGELPKFKGLCVLDGALLFDRQAGYDLLHSMGMMLVCGKRPASVPEFIGLASEEARLKLTPLQRPPEKLLIDDQVVDV